MTPSEQRGVVDAARLRLKAAIKAAWSREAVTRGVAAAKKTDYALAHRHATACAFTGTLPPVHANRVVPACLARHGLPPSGVVQS